MINRTQVRLRPFPKGFLITDGEALQAPTWYETLFLGGSWFLHHDSSLPVNVVKNAHFTVTVLGTCYCNNLGLINEGEVARFLEKSLETDLSEGNFTRITHDLAGRFVIAVSALDTLMVVGDPLGSIPSWWGCVESFAVSNYSKLLADHFEAHSSAQKKAFFEHPDYKSGQPWLSNIVPEYDVALPVLPNHCLRFDGGVISHERFYPTSPLQLISVDDAAHLVYEELRFSVENLAGRGPVFFSITAGDDAFAFVDIAADILRDSQSVGITYAFLNGEANPTHNDLIGANRRMLNAGIPHMIAPMSFEWGSEFARVYSETHPTMAVFPTLAKTMFETGDGVSYFLTGHGGEIGNVFYKERVKGFPSPIDLAEKNGTRRFAESDLGRSSIMDFIEYGQFFEERIFNYDPYDLLYWENRLGRWGARMMGEWDFGARPVSPFSSRRLIDSMMSVPFEDRVGRSIYGRLHEIFGQIGHS